MLDSSPPSQRATRARRPAACAALVLAAAGAAGACSGEKAKRQGEIVLSIQNDMAIPDDIDTLRIEIEKNGVLQHANNYDLTPPGGAKIPATLGIVADPDNPGAVVTIRVSAIKGGDPAAGGTARTLNEIVTTVPRSRVATLRVPIQFLCDGEVDQNGKTISSACAQGEACIAGRCRAVRVEEKTLPVYDPALIFGGGSGNGDGTCYDVGPCFDEAAVVAVDMATCRITPPDGADRVAVGLVTLGAGICGRTACFVALDEGAEHGWYRVGADGGPTAGASGPIQLPEAVCDKITDGKVLEVRLATASGCDEKTASKPTCGPWSSVDGGTGSQEAPPEECVELCGLVTAADCPGSSRSECLSYCVPAVGRCSAATRDYAACGKQNAFVCSTVAPFAAISAVQCDVQRAAFTECLVGATTDGGAGDGGAGEGGTQ